MYIVDIDGCIVTVAFFVVFLVIPLLIKHRLFPPITVLSYFIIGLVSDKKFFLNDPRQFFWIIEQLPEYKKRALREQGVNSYIALKRAIAQADYKQILDIFHDIDGDYTK